MLCYREWVRWWACEYLQILVWKHRGKPDPVKPTYRDVKLMPRLQLPFNQNWGKNLPHSPLPVCISLCLSFFPTLAAKQQTRSTSGMKLPSLDYTPPWSIRRSEVSFYKEVTERLMKCARQWADSRERESTEKKVSSFGLADTSIITVYSVDGELSCQFSGEFDKSCGGWREDQFFTQTEATLHQTSMIERHMTVSHDHSKRLTLLYFELHVIRESWWQCLFESLQLREQLCEAVLMSFMLTS